MKREERVRACIFIFFIFFIFNLFARRLAAAFFSTDDEKSECVGVMLS
jgi:hypothetical protein